MLLKLKYQKNPYLYGGDHIRLEKELELILKSNLNIGNALISMASEFLTLLKRQ